MIDLLPILEEAGVKNLRTTQKEVVGSCPMHKARTGQPDRHVGNWSINRISFKHNCYSCGYGGNLNSLLIDLTGSAPEDLADELRKQNFLANMADVRRNPGTVLEEAVPLLTEWALKEILTDVPQRLLDLKGLQRPAVDAYEVRWDKETRRWVLPLRDPRGDLLGAQYRQKGSVMTMPAGIAKADLLFGYTTVRSSNFCAIVESPLDAVRLYGLGVPAVSSLGAYVSRQQATLVARNFDCVYIAMDNDNAGKKGADVLEMMLRRAGTACTKWNYERLVDEDGEPAKDVGDATDISIMETWDITKRWGF